LHHVPRLPDTAADRQRNLVVRNRRVAERAQEVRLAARIDVRAEDMLREDGRHFGADQVEFATPPVLGAALRRSRCVPTECVNARMPRAGNRPGGGASRPPAPGAARRWTARPRPRDNRRSRIAFASPLARAAEGRGPNRGGSPEARLRAG
jgi:hypothetical protein